MADDKEFDAMYEQLFGDDPAPIPPSIPKRVLNALSTATCGNCQGTLKRSMVGWIHAKGGTSVCYTVSRPERAKSIEDGE
jgi:hypothetical protein